MKEQRDRTRESEKHDGNESVSTGPKDTDEISDDDLESVSGGGDGTGTGVTWNP